MDEKPVTIGTPLIGGVVVTLVVVLLLCFAIGLLLRFTPLTEAYMGSYVLAAVTLGVFAGAYTASKAAHGRGLIMGLLVAGVFIVLLLLAAWLGRYGISWASFLRCAFISLLAGILGGLVGVSSR